MKILYILVAIFSLLASQALAKSMSIKSESLKSGRTLKDDKHVYGNFGCTGDNISPQITIKNIPKNTKSLAITMYDPNVPTGSGWWHWIAYDIPPHISEIKEGDKEIADGVKFAKNDYGKSEYGGPCPPKGKKHRYIIKVYALNIEQLPVTEGDSSAALIGYNLQSHLIKDAKLRFYYKR